MLIHQIIFPEKNKAKLISYESPSLKPDEVMVKTAYTALSCGTERATIVGMKNAGAEDENGNPIFPRDSGYSCTGTVVEVGADVKSVKVGDKVAVWESKHKDYNIKREKNIIKITDENISMKEAALCYVASFSIAGVRKTRVELGESCMVMGLGILGQLAVQFAHAAGAVPVIAADPNEERRNTALKFGADYAFDPLSPDFAENVKKVTGGGVNTAVEVTGVGAGLDETLDCMSKFGRISLLGCTRDKNFTIDYYNKIHKRGVQIIGASTIARPELQSYPAFFTVSDDIKATLKLLAGKRLHFDEVIHDTYSPADCEEVYTRLVEDKNFPPVVLFDWSKLEG